MPYIKQITLPSGSTYDIRDAEAEHYKGTLGSGGDIGTLPTASTDNKGDLYSVITAGTYAGKTAVVDDLFMSDGTAWILIQTHDTTYQTTDTVTEDSTALVTSGAVWTAIDNLPEPMIFKGSVGDGTGVTVTWTNLPAAATGNIGWTYKVVTKHTTAPICEVGDTIISDGTNWVVIPSGDEPSGTVTSVGVTNATNGGLTITGSPITSSGTITVGHTNVVTAGTAKGDDSKTLTFGGTFTVPSVTYDTNGHITSKGSTTMTMPTNPNTDRYVNSAAFADDTTSSANSPVKMTLTRAGSDSATVTANIPKVSSTSAGVAPKGSAVTTQTQTTKFLREDGTWATPSYSSTVGDTWRNIKVDGTEKLGTATTTGAVDFVSGSNVSLEWDGTDKSITVNATDTTYSTTSGSALTGLGTPTTDTFVKSYPGTTSKLAVTSVTGVSGSTTASKATAGTAVAVATVGTAKTVATGSLGTETSTRTANTPMWGATVSNEVLSFTFKPLDTSSVTPAVSNGTITSYTFADVTVPTAASSATTVATGSLTSTGSGASVMTGLGTPTTADAIKSITPTSDTFIKTVTAN